MSICKLWKKAKSFIIFIRISKIYLLSCNVDVIGRGGKIYTYESHEVESNMRAQKGRGHVVKIFAVK